MTQFCILIDNEQESVRWLTQYFHPCLLCVLPYCQVIVAQGNWCQNQVLMLDFMPACKSKTHKTLAGVGQCSAQLQLKQMYFYSS